MVARSIISLAVAVALGFAVGRSYPPRNAESDAVAPTETDSTDRVLTAMQHRLADALGARDTLRLDSLLSEKFLAINGAAKVLTKSGALAELANLPYRLLSVEDDSIQVRRFGPCAVVTARETIRARVDSREEIGHLRLTNIWVEEGSRWRTVGGQATVQP